MGGMRIYGQYRKGCKNSMRFANPSDAPWMSGSQFMKAAWRQSDFTQSFKTKVFYPLRVRRSMASMPAVAEDSVVGADPAKYIVRCTTYLIMAYYNKTDGCTAADNAVLSSTRFVSAPVYLSAGPMHGVMCCRCMTVRARGGRGSSASAMLSSPRAAIGRPRPRRPGRSMW